MEEKALCMGFAILWKTCHNLKDVQFTLGKSHNPIQDCTKKEFGCWVAATKISERTNVGTGHIHVSRATLRRRRWGGGYVTHQESGSCKWTNFAGQLTNSKKKIAKKIRSRRTCPPITPAKLLLMVQSADLQTPQPRGIGQRTHVHSKSCLHCVFQISVGAPEHVKAGCK
jgi:hypothetical protein